MINFFSLFDVPHDFQLDQAALKQRYQALIATVHPDRFAHLSDSEQSMAVMKSAQLNDAFTALSNPITRAEHLLELAGLGQHDESKTVSDIEFLMLQMELREQLEIISSETKPFDAIENLREKIQGYKTEYLASLSTHASDKEWQMMRPWIDKLKFIEKLEIELERVEDALFD